MCLSGRIYNQLDHRKTLESKLYNMCTGIQWRDLTSYFSAWSAIWSRFSLWSKKDILNELFRILSRDTCMDQVFIYGSIVMAQQYNCGVRIAENESIGKVEVGLQKIHLAVDSRELPVYYELSCVNMQIPSMQSHSKLTSQ